MSKILRVGTSVAILVSFKCGNTLVGRSRYQGADATLW